MKQWSVAGIAMLMTFFAVSKNTTVELKFAKNVVVAHRGAFKANSLPENSIASLRHAIQLNCTGTEFDVRMTADDSLIIHHDEDYHGMHIETSKFADLQKHLLPNGERLPTLKEYLVEGLQNNLGTRLILEIKPSGMGKERAMQITDAVVKLVEELKAAQYIVYISFDYNMLLRIRQLNPSASTQYLEGDKPPAQIKADGISGLDYHYSVFEKNPEWVLQAKELGLLLNAWTVNDSAKMEELLNMGFDFITTNEPEMLLKKITR